MYQTLRDLEFKESDSIYIFDHLKVADFAETGLLVKSLLESAYTSGITGLQDVDESDGVVTGVFLDQVSSSLTRKFKFKIDSDGITYSEVASTDYSELNSDLDFVEFESKLFKYSNTVDFSTKSKLPKLGSKTKADILGRVKTCNPTVSFVCGKVCKSNGLSCSTQYTANNKAAYAEILRRSSAMKSENLDQYLTSKTKSTGGAVAPQKSTLLSAKPGLRDTIKGAFGRIGSKIKEEAGNVKNYVKQAVSTKIDQTSSKIQSKISGLAGRVNKEVELVATKAKSRITNT